MAAQQPYTFRGWQGLDKSSAQGKMVWRDFQPKKWEETDVDIKVTHCGICGSDLHTLRSGVCSIFHSYALCYFSLLSCSYPPCVSLDVCCTVAVVMVAGFRVMNSPDAAVLKARAVTHLS